MLKFGSVLVPTSALIFLGVVIFLFLILMVALLFLNKLLCFANCYLPSLVFTDISEKDFTDSESDDSDEDIYNNYAYVEKSVEADKFRASMRSKRDYSFRKEKDKDSLESLEGEVVGDSNKDKILNSSKRHGKVAVLRVHLFLDTLSSKLKIQVAQIFDLVGPKNNVDFQNVGMKMGVTPISSYQIHCSVLPNKKHRFQTKIRQGGDPIFNEIFYVPKVTEENLDSLSIRFRLYTGQSSVLNVAGQCTCDMRTVDLLVDTEYNLTMIEPKDDDCISADQLSFYGSEVQSTNFDNIEGHDNEPELMIGLTHNSNTGRLSVEIIRGTSFSKDKNKDFYVKLSIFSSSGQELSHAKTSVRKNTTSPVFRESFMFQVALFQLKDVTLMVSAFAKKSIHRKDLIGWISLGYKSSGEEEANHWHEIMDGIKTEVVRSHKLHKNSNSKKFLQ